ncbi:MATE family efflux transporter [Brachyspira pilosicoli]|uniref:Multidrug-efflux transporter n=1 Tax=Brachyspira pilosicoli TaxID=52584 RepID=A0A5C8F2M8_BRAPL|nr:MATE family efflux transporter [Brachyspira pilosicoli]TXJ42800.1 MATE family efflux transporter [Brachyspira pilosicoli]
MKEQTLTQGKILKSLILFAFPVLIALFLQAMYGAADLIIVGQFAGTNEQSGVASGSQLFNMITMIITGLTMGITVFVGDAIGTNKKENAGKGIGSGIIIFAVIAIIITLIIVPFSDLIASYMHAPKEAFKQTSNYIKICAMGTMFIVAYNCIGAIFRGIGDSKTPLITVAIACFINIVGDIILVALFNMGASGATIVSSQAISVVFSLYFISKKKLPFNFSRKYIRLEKECVKKILIIGSPIALQEMLVQFSFLFIQVIVNGMGVMESAAVGVAEKVCVFLMLVASAYMQSISAFVAQNNGAGLYERSQKALIYGIRTALIAGMCTSIITLVFGSLLSNIFSNERLVILASYSYLKAYAIDCLLTAILFCFVGYFNGCSKTLFVMIQGIVGAFFVRIPVVYLMSQIDNASLFYIGLATPISSIVQIILCLVAYNYYKRDLCNSEKLEKSYSTI